jgi:hypothetical protein
MTRFRLANKVADGRSDDAGGQSECPEYRNDAMSLYY